MMPRQYPAIHDQNDLFASAPKLPEGFACRNEIISPIEDRALVERFEELPFKPFEFYGFLAKRRIVSFGWHYDFP
jgi:hypothetical protein